MVIKFAELEINLQWKWFLRPRQRDGMTVDDYYAQFCNWKEEMISVSFPAKEEDYIDGFIDNLRWDIRWGLSKYKCSRYKLTNAFYNARFEESSLIIEENIKQIMVCRVFDDMPSRNPVSVGSEKADCTDDDDSEADLESNEQQQDLGYDKSISAMAKFHKEGHEVFTEMSELNFVEACDERSETNVQEVEAFISATPITGISVTRTNAIRFEGATHDKEFDGRENFIYSEVCEVFDELHDSENIQVLDVIKGNDSSIEIVNDGNHLTKMFLPKSFLKDEETGLKRGKKHESGLQVLSIYCAYMASKWNNILELRPRQSKDMSVDVYYDLFFNWKLKLEEVDFIGGEESYIDDFIYGLELKLGMRVWEYKWKPCTLYGAFRRAVFEETMMKNDVDMVLEEMPHPNSIDNEGVVDVYGNVVLEVGSKFVIHSLIEEDNEPGKLLLQKPFGLDEGSVVDGGVVHSLFDLQESLGPLGDLTANSSGNGLTKAWCDEATSSIKMVSRKRVIEDDAYKVFGETTQAIRAALLGDEVINHSAKYTNFNKLVLFDPGGRRKCVMSLSTEVARKLFGKGLGTWEPSMVDSKDAAAKMMFPGIGYRPLIGCDSISSSKMCNNSVSNLWIDKMLFCFDLDLNTSVLGTWSLKNTISISWDRQFDDTGWYIVDIVEGEDHGAQGKDFLEIFSSRRSILIVHTTFIWNFSLIGDVADYLASYDTSALKAINGSLMKQMYNGRFDPFDVFLKLLVDYSNFTLLIAIYLSQNGRHLCDLVLPLSLFIPRIHWPVISTKDHDTSQAVSKVMALYMFCLKGILQRGYLHEIIFYTFSIVITRIRGTDHGVWKEFLYYWKLGSSYDVLDASPLPRKSKTTEDAYGGYPNAKQRCIFVQTDHIIVVSCKFDHVAMQMAHMLQLVKYGGYPYDHGSYTILALENGCLVNFFPTSNVAHTNVAQGAENGDVRNGAASGIWLQLRNEDFWVCCLVLGAHLGMMSSVKADCLLLETMLEPLLSKHSNGIMVKAIQRFQASALLCLAQQ